jgi:thioredoxin reductase (NADPH)
MAENNSYDVIVIGGGPAGLTAGLYTSRARLNSLLIENRRFRTGKPYVKAGDQVWS